MALTCDAEEAVPVIWCQWCCMNSGFGEMSVGSQKCRKIKEESVVLLLVQLYGALAILPRMMPSNGMALTCDAEEVVPVIWWQWCCKNSGFEAMSVPPGLTVWCIGNITQNDAYKQHGTHL